MHSSDKSSPLLIFMDLIEFLALLLMYGVPAVMIVLSFTLVKNILLLMMAITWLGIAFFIHHL
ncbi:MAG: hypothetical protein RXP98_06450 [Thermoplasmata archaeon]